MNAILSHAQPSRLFSVLVHAALGVLVASQAQADGCFVKPVWNKQIDINEPTQKAIMVYDRGREDLLLQVKYEGPVNEFGWLVPVPSVPKVEKGSMACFYELSRMTQGVTDSKGSMAPGVASLGTEHQEPVRGIEQKTVGAYEVAVLAASDAGSLQHWLEQNQFAFPKENAAAIETYIRKGWYFVALRIQLGVGDAFNLDAPGTVRAASAKTRAAKVGAKLAQGELHPLQISFDTPRCIFPLKISAVNGHPSELSLYVLAREPLLESSIFAQDVDDARREADKGAGTSTPSWEGTRLMALEMRYRASGVPMSTEEREATRTLLRTENPWSERPRAGFYITAGPQFRRGLTAAQLTQCARQVPRLRTGEWCLTKQVRTFAPADMHDLEFEPAAAVLGAYLVDEQAGPAMTYLLHECGLAGRDRLLQALSSKNAVERAIAACDTTSDDGMRRRLVGMTHDPEPKVRARAIEAGYGGRGAQEKSDSQRLEEMLQFFKDPDIEVRQAAAGAISREDVAQNRPRFLEMLRDPDPRVQPMAFGLLARDFEHSQIPREDLRRLFATTNLETACSLSWVPLAALSEASSDDLAILLTNRFINPRLAAIALLEQQPDKRAIEVGMMALKDPNMLVQRRAWRFLMAETDQKFASTETRKWEEWWAAHRDSFTPKSAAELREQSMARMRRSFESRGVPGPK